MKILPHFRYSRGLPSGFTGPCIANKHSLQLELLMPLYPSRVTIAGQVYTFERILKDDFFSLNILYENHSNPRYVLKVSDFRFLLGFLL